MENCFAFVGTVCAVGRAVVDQGEIQVCGVSVTVEIAGLASLVLVIGILAILLAVVDVLERNAVVAFTEEPVTVVVHGFVGCIGAVGATVVDHDKGDFRAVLTEVGIGSVWVSILVLARIAVIPSVVDVVERDGVAVVTGEFPVFLVAELRGIEVAPEAEDVVFNVVVVRHHAAELEVVLVRAVVAIFLSIVHPVGWNLLPVIAVEGFLFVRTVISAAANPALEDLGKRVLKFGLEVLCHGFAEGFAGVAQHVAHHDEHDRVAGRAGVASHDVDGRTVAKVNLEWSV